MLLRKHVTAKLLLASLALSLLGCDDSSPIATPFNSNNPVEVSPKTASLEALGDTVRLSATTRRTPIQSTFNWTSLNPSIATVDEQGHVVARAVGEARIVAMNGTGADTALIAVTQVPAFVTVRRLGADTMVGDPVQSGDENTVGELEALGEALQLESVVRDRRQNLIPDAETDWNSLDPEIASVASNGVVYASSNGAARVVGRSGHARDTAVVVVNQRLASLDVTPERKEFNSLGMTQTLAVALKDRNGQPVTSAVTFTSSRPSVATVSSSGKITAVSNGTASIVAKSGNFADTMSVSVIQVVKSIAIYPTAVTVTLGQSTTLKATAFDALGSAVAGPTFTWSSSSSEDAGVDAFGRVTARSVGSATITAIAQGFTATATVTVSPTAVASISIAPGLGNLEPGDVLQLTATTRDANYSVLTGRLVTWTSSNPNVATVSHTGLVDAQTDGATTITATSEGKSASINVVVRTPVAAVGVLPAAPTLNIGGTVLLSAVPKDAAGNDLSNRPVTWTSSNGAVASVDGAGRVTARAAGTSNIYATSESVVGFSRVTVTSSAPVATVALAPESASLQVGGALTLVATLKDAQGNVLTGRAITWTSSDPSVAGVSATGTVTGLEAGTVTITARSEEKTATSQVTVSTTPTSTGGPTRIVITPAADTLDALGATRQFTAVAYDANGKPVIAAIQWQSLNTNAATVTAGGVVTAKTIGTALIVAAVNASCADTTAVVVQQLVDSIAVTPAAASIQQGSNFKLSGQAYDSRKNPIPSAQLVWISDDPSIATVDASGNVTAVSTGSTRIRAKKGEIYGSATVNVTATSAVVVASVVINPATDTISGVGGTGQLAATARNSSGTELSGVALNWTSLNPAIATVDATGRVTAVGAGTARVVASATCCAVSDTATVLVNAASQSASLTLNPSSTFVNEGTSTTLTAVLRDALGNIVTGATITWSSSDNQVASVSTTGVVTGVHAGSAVITASGNGLTATSSVTVSVPGQYAAPDLASTNLEAGSSSPFTDTNGSSTGNSYVTLMNDPTGQFGGKVARFRFNRTSTAASVDVNRALSFTHPTGVGLGQTVFMRGHVLIPTPASNMSKAMRKLIYVQRQPNDASFAVIKANGNTLKAEITGNRVFSGGAFPYDRKVSIEIQITANSAIGVADGIFRIWKDGVLVVDRSDVLWLTSTSKFKEIKFGQQTQHELHDATILFDEYRYWDNLAVSTRRIGP